MMLAPKTRQIWRPASRFAIAAVIAAATGCHRWIEVPLAPNAAQEPANLGNVEVTRTDGERLRLRRVTIGADSLRWHRTGLFVKKTAEAMPRDSVAGLRRRTLDRKRTAWAALGVLGGLVVMAAGPGAGPADHP